MNSLFFRFISGFLIFLVVSSIGMCVSSYVTDMHMGHMHEIDVSNKHVSHALSLMQSTESTSFVFQLTMYFFVFTALSSAVLFLIPPIFHGSVYTSFFIRRQRLIEVFFQLRSPPIFSL